MAPPPGGPPDKTPPKLIKTIPPVKNTIKNNNILLIFSEEIKKNSVINSFSINPKLKYKLKIQKNKINIKLLEYPKDSILLIKFNTQLQDIHNNKMLNDILLIFGPPLKIPKNSIKGKLYILDNSIKLSKVKLTLYEKNKKIRNFNFTEKNKNFLIDYIKESKNLILQVFYDKNQNGYCDPEEYQNIFIPTLNKNNIIFLKKNQKQFSINKIKIFCSRIIELTTSDNFKKIISNKNNYLINKANNKIYFYYEKIFNKKDSLNFDVEILKLNNEIFSFDTLLTFTKDSINISKPKFIYSYNDTIPYYEKTINLLCNIPIPSLKIKLISKNDTITPVTNNIKNLLFSVDISKLTEDMTLLISNNDSLIIRKKNFYKIPKEKLSTIKIDLSDSTIFNNMITFLFNINKNTIYYNKITKQNSTINNIYPGHYILGIFDDKNDNTFLDNGYIINDSVKYSEPIKILEDTLKVRSYWIIEGIKIK